MTLRDRYHVLMGELWGKISSKAIVQIAKHADKADDIITVERAASVLAHGLEVGWSPADPDGGKIVPGRSKTVAAAAIEELRRRRDVALSR